MLRTCRTLGIRPASYGRAIPRHFRRYSPLAATHNVRRLLKCFRSLTYGRLGERTAGLVVRRLGAASQTCDMGVSA